MYRAAMARWMRASVVLLFMAAALCAQEPKEVSRLEALEHLIRTGASQVPAYPPLARQARIMGKVVLTVQIGKDGDVKDVKVVEGHPMLAPPAVEAVRKWRFSPFMEDDAPIEVSAPVEIRFNLGDPDANLADAFNRSIGQAREALATKDYAEAERNARQALEDANDRPGHKRLAAEAEYVLAQIALAQDRNARPDFDACIRLYREASGDNELPPSAEVVNDAFYAAGTYYFNEADDRSAENTLTLPVIAWNSTGGKQKELAIAAALLGQARFRLGDLAGAARACEIFRSHEKALRGLELDAARQRCSAIR